MPTLDDAAVQARLADMLVRCGIERGVLGRIDADNVARILLPIVREAAEARAAEELEHMAGDPDMAHPMLGPGVRSERLDARAAALRGLDGTQPPP
jgi:hypothetical protein